MTYPIADRRRAKLLSVLVAAVLLALIFVQGTTQRAESQSESPGSAQEPTFPEENERDFASGKIIVKLEEDATQRDLRELNRENNARTEEDLPRSDLNVIDLPNDVTVREGVEAYEDSPDIEYAEPDFILQPTATPNDPDYGNMYGLNNTGQTGGTPGADTDSPEAWDISTGNTSTMVAVIDTGADVSHPDLDGNLWRNSDEIPDNGIDDDNNGYVDDVNGWDFANDDASLYDPDFLTGEGDEHGTHVAGTIADDDDKLASFSNFGDQTVDLGAPGVGILSTLPDNSYARYNGTSMATPHVSGAAALIKSENPAFDDAKLKSQILGTVEAVPSLNGETVTGGRLNSAQALGIRFTELSLSASPQTLNFGAGAALPGRLNTTSGDALGGRTVVVQQRPVGGSFTNVGETTTASDGSFQLSGVKPQKHSDYRAYFPGNNADKLEPSTSVIRRVNVRVLVTLNTQATNLKLGKGRTISGAVRPLHGGAATVTIKRNGSVIANRKVALNDSSQYRFAYKPQRPGTYAFFATYPKHADHLGNRSPQKSFKVVR